MHLILEARPARASGSILFIVQFAFHAWDMPRQCSERGLDDVVSSNLPACSYKYEVEQKRGHKLGSRNSGLETVASRTVNSPLQTIRALFSSRVNFSSP